MVTLDELKSGDARICVVGLGYVGLPLAVLMSRAFSVIGYDRDSTRVKGLTEGHDRTGEVSEDKLRASGIEFSDDPAVVKKARLVLMAIPTPVDDHSNPDLDPLRGATAAVGRNLAPDTVVVYESTVFPGATEDVCLPILERESGLRYKQDFWLGYSPERVNPGDKTHTIDQITKVVAGDTSETGDLLAGVYGAVVTAGVHRAPDIRTAEAAKVIENIQRDLNIALMNELSVIFGKLGLDTRAVLEAAGTKWNFLKFEPGLVGGHCIPVDPYYLTYRAQQAGYHPEVILAGRRMNDSMAKHVAEQTVKQVVRAGLPAPGARVLVLGLTFKEDVPDFRNSQAVDVCRELADYGLKVFAYDPYASGNGALTGGHGALGADIAQVVDSPDAMAPYDAVVVAVKHSRFRELTLDFLASISNGRPVLIDVKGAYDPAEARERGLSYWRL